MLNPVHVFCAVTRTLTEFRPPTLPSLGDALAVLAAPAGRAPEVASAAVTAAPWCAVVLLVEQRLPAAEAGALLPILPHTTVILDGDLSLPPARITESLNRRPAPSAADLLAYLRLRGLPRELVAAVEDALAASESESESESESRKIAPAPHRSTINRRLADVGPLRARSWRALLHLLQLSAPTGASVEQAAWLDRSDPRTLRVLTHKLLGVGPGPALDTPGWEWKLEAALRRHAYVSWPPSTRRSSAGLTAPILLEV